MRALTAAHIVLAVSITAPMSCAIAGPAYAQSPPAPASVFTSSEGFSISYPSGWMTASKEKNAALLQRIRPYMAKLGHTNLRPFAVNLFNPSNRGYAPNLIVVISPHHPNITDEHEEDMRSMVLTDWKAAGTVPRDLRINIEPFAGRDAMVARYDVAVHGRLLSQMQVIIPGRDQAYIVTCTSASADNAQYRPVFATMINSMVVDIGVSPLPRWVTGWVHGSSGGGVSIAVLALLIGLLLKARKRRIV